MLIMSRWVFFSEKLEGEKRLVTGIWLQRKSFRVYNHCLNHLALFIKDFISFLRD